MKVLDVKELINNRKTGLYYININDKEVLEKKLKEARAEGLLQKNNITYSYTIHKHYIALILSSSICNLIKN